MTEARAVPGFRFKDGSMGEEGSVPVINVYLDDDHYVTLFPSDEKLAGLVARSSVLATAEGIRPHMPAKDVLAKMTGKVEVLYVCEDTEGTSIKLGTAPYELIFHECGMKDIRDKNAKLMGIGIP